MFGFPGEERAMIPGNKESQRCSAALLGSCQPAWRHHCCFSRSLVPGNWRESSLPHASWPVSTHWQERRKEARGKRRELAEGSTSAFSLLPPSQGQTSALHTPSSKLPNSPSLYKGNPESTISDLSDLIRPCCGYPSSPCQDPGPEDRP